MLPRLDMTPPSRVSPAWGASGPRHEASTRVEGIDRHAGYSEGVACDEGRQAALVVHYSAAIDMASSALNHKTSPSSGLSCSHTGTVGETVTGLSQRLLAQYGGLRGLFRLDLSELARNHGVGDAKSVRLKAALELGRRLAALSPDDRA
jgi:hypothetical protein